MKTENKRTAKPPRKTKTTSKEDADLKFRDLSITKICANCGKEYHPRKNSYQIVSRFCSTECVKENRQKTRGRFF